MAGIGNQRHRVREEPKTALDEHENQVQPDRDTHAGIDSLGRYAVSVPVRVAALVIMIMTLIVGAVVMVMVKASPMVMRTVILMFHSLYIPSAARITRSPPSRPPLTTPSRPTTGGRPDGVPMASDSGARHPLSASR